MLRIPLLYKYLILIPGFLLVGILSKSPALIAQTEIEDPEELRIKALNDLATSYIADSPTLAISYAHEALELAKKNNIQFEKARALSILGDGNVELDDYRQAANLYLNSLDIYKNLEKNEDIIAPIKSKIGKQYFFLGKYSDAINFFKEALLLYQALDDDEGKANVFHKMGQVYAAMEKQDLALENYQKSLLLNKKIGNKIDMAALYQNIGIVYYSWQSYDETIKYYQKSLDIYKEIDHPIGMASTSSNIGLVNEVMENYEVALNYYSDALEGFRKANYQRGIIYAMYNVASALRHLERYDESIAQYEASADLAAKYGFSRHIVDVYQSLSEVYADINNYKEALVYHKQYVSLKDSLSEEASQKEIAEIEAKYDLKLKEHELTTKDEQLDHQQALNIVLVGGTGVLLILASLLLWSNIQKRRAKKALELHRDKLEEIVKQRSAQLKVEINERKAAEEADRLKTAFLSNMSHEIRTPMNAIIAFSEFLKEDNLDSESRLEYINHITSSGNNLLQLIDDIIDSAKIEARQMKIKKEAFNVNQMLISLKALYSQPKMSKNKNAVKLNLFTENQDQNVYIFTDRIRLQQILSNLLDNAFKYTDAGIIEFGFTEEKEYLKFFVKDTGIGIPWDKQKIIFERFGQAENINTRSFGGTGLGLNICKNLVQLMGGKIWVNSDPGKGSVFYFIIPVIPAEKPLQKQEIAPVKKINQVQNWADKNILVAEDDDLNFKVIETALRSSKAYVIRAHNGLEALEAYERHHIDVTLMDIQMPEMDGYEATKRIKRSYPGTFVIAQTAFAMAGEKDKCKAAGCDDYISKPIRLAELYEKLNRVLEPDTEENNPIT